MMFLRRMACCLMIAWVACPVLNAQDSGPSETGVDAAERQFHVFKLDRIEADVAQRLLQTLFEGAGELRVEADREANRLFVYGTREKMERVEKLLKQLGELIAPAESQSPASEEEDEPTQVERVFTLTRHVDPNEIVQLFEAQFGKEGKWAVNVTGNRLRFLGTEKQMQAAADLIAKLMIAKPNERQIKVFNLQNADAADLNSLLRELFPDSSLKVSVDGRTNSIVAAGVPEDLDVVHAILLRLDQATPEWRQRQPPQGARDNRSIPDSESGGADRAPAEGRVADALQESYTAAEREAESRAAIYRWAEAAGTESPEELQRMKDELQSAVEAAFAARQRLQAAEVEQLKQQLSRIETRLRQRAAVNEEIIQRRMDDLLQNVDTSWWPQTPSSPDADTVTEVRHSPRPLDAQQLPQLKGKVQLEYIEDLDVMVMRGKPDDVEALGEIIQRLEQNKPSSDAAAGAEKVQLDLRNAPWKHVLEWLAEQYDRDLQVEDWPMGTLNLVQHEAIPLHDAYETIRKNLLMKGFEIELDDKELRVSKVPDNS